MSIENSLQLNESCTQLMEEQEFPLVNGSCRKQANVFGNNITESRWPRTSHRRFVETTEVTFRPAVRCSMHVDPSVEDAVKIPQVQSN
jgi:hypothetical protein